jgi:hypothetical protein
VPSGSADDLPEVEIVPGYSSRLADWDGMTVAFEKAHAGQDASSMVKGLPDDRCQAPHWGYLFTGKMTVDYGDRQETIEGGRAYYVAPGHLITFNTDCEALEFTPTEALEQTLEAVRRNYAAGQPHGG